MRAALAILAACLVAGCGAAGDRTPSAKSKDPGVLVFGGAIHPGVRHPPAAYYALQPDGTGLRKLALPDGADELSFSADGRFAAMSDSRGESSRIVVLHADGSDSRVVPLPGDAYASSPSVSPDGKTLALAYSPDIEAQDAPDDVWTVSVDGRDLRQLESSGNVINLAWSPDGKRIAFLDEALLEGDVYKPGADLYIVGADGTGLHRIAGSAAGYSPPAWSPDGRRIAFDDVDGRVKVIDANGGEAAVVGTQGESPAWSPDGSRLAFLRVTACSGYTTCNRARIIVVDPDRATPPQEVGPVFGEQRSLAWTTASPLLSEGTSTTARKPNS